MHPIFSISQFYISMQSIHDNLTSHSLIVMSIHSILLEIDLYNFVSIFVHPKSLQLNNDYQINNQHLNHMTIFIICSTSINHH